MNDIAIRCEGLGKRYRIGEREKYKVLRDVLTDVAASPFRRLRSVFRNGNGHSPSGIQDPAASFWALEDVSFEVKRGEEAQLGSPYRPHPQLRQHFVT